MAKSKKGSVRERFVQEVLGYTRIRAPVIRRDFQIGSYQRSSNWWGHKGDHWRLMAVGQGTWADTCRERKKSTGSELFNFFIFHIFYSCL